MMRIYGKDDRKFYVTVRKNIAYIATEAWFSSIAGQMIVNEAMQETGLQHAGLWTDIITDDGNFVPAVGYKLPVFFKKQALDNMVDVLSNYEHTYSDDSDPAYSAIL